MRGALAVGTRDPGRELGVDDLELLGEVAWLSGAALAGQDRRAEVAGTVASQVDALATALSVWDGHTRRHSDTVVELARRTGTRMGLDHMELLELELAALLHDVGKLRVPREILRKTGPLSDSEGRLMRNHPAWGAELRVGRAGAPGGRADRAPPPRAGGRQRLPEPALRGPHPGRLTHHGRLRRLRRDDRGAAVPRQRSSRGTRSPSCATRPATSSTRRWSMRSRPRLDPETPAAKQPLDPRTGAAQVLGGRRGPPARVRAAWRCSSSALDAGSARAFSVGTQASLIAGRPRKRVWEKSSAAAAPLGSGRRSSRLPGRAVTVPASQSTAKSVLVAARCPRAVRPAGWARTSTPWCGQVRARTGRGRRPRRRATSRAGAGRAGRRSARSACAAVFGRWPA